LVTHSLNIDAFAAMGGPDLVYVRVFKAKEVLDGGEEVMYERFSLHPDQTLYALHRADGARLAVLADRESAFAAAIAHELAPVSVH
jgi:hypothetical protein